MSDAAARGSTATRMRFVAPPSMTGEVKISTTIGRYEITKTLGKGAMGVVYEARDPLLDRIVAVKTIVPPRSGGKRAKQAYLERFKREAMAAAKMQHPAIVTIFDVGVDEKSGAPFMVLEYLPGDSLADRLDHYRLRLGKCVQVAQDLAGALGFAHRKRIVHRDLKPANVLNAGDDRWKLADFGIARLPDSELTQVGIFMGTPGYAPPESIREGLYTPQADVFAWGAVFYELLSGKIPYEGPDTKTTNKQVVNATAKSPRHWDASIPEPLAEVCMRALHPDPNDRYRTGEEVEVALRDAWEKCLAEDIVSAQSLSGRDMRHEEVHGELHVAPRKPAAPSQPPPMAPPMPAGDDDPTRMRERPPAPPAAAPPQIPARVSPAPAPSRQPDIAGHELPKQNLQPVVAPRPLGSSPVFRRPTSYLEKNTALWIAVAVLGVVGLILLLLLLKL